MIQQKKNTLVLFDIDFTLFDARKYREKFVSRLKEKIGYKGEDFLNLAEESYIASKQKIGYFDPATFIDELLLRTKANKDRGELVKIILDKDLINRYLYPDTIEILKKISREKNMIIGIFSAGKISLQRPKIKPIEHFLNKEHINIFEFHKGNALPKLIKGYQDYKIYLVDDIQDILVKAKKLRPDITTIWIQRKGYTKSTEPVANFAPDYIIKTLTEVTALIRL